MTRNSKPLLTVSHYIYLTREQRYSVFNGEAVKTVGVSVPVWFRDGDTSEPAKEVFCMYTLFSEDGAKGISNVEDGYVINLRAFDKSANLQSILDVKDRGSEELIVKGYTRVPLNGKNFSVFHCLEIKTTDVLFDTLC